MTSIKLIPAIFAIVGFVFIGYAEFSRPDHSTQIAEVIALEKNLLEKLTASLDQKGLVSLDAQQKIFHAEVLQIAGTERTIRDILLSNERYTRNFALSILGVCLAAIGLYGIFGINFFIKRVAEMAENDLKNGIDVKFDAAKGTLFNHVGFVQYRHYCNSKSHQNCDPASDPYLYSAIVSSEYALQSFNDVNDEYLDDYDLCAKYSAMMNRAYYLAERKAAGDSREALRLSDTVYTFGRNRRCHQHLSQWRETYAFVLFQYGMEHQKEYAFEVIKKLLADEDMSNTKWKKKIEKKWEDLRRLYKDESQKTTA